MSKLILFNKNIFSLVILLVLSNTQISKSEESRVKKLLCQDYVVSTLSLVPIFLKDNLRPLETQIGPQKIALLHNAIDDVYNVENLTSRVLDCFSDNLETGTIDSIYNWSKSSIYLKVMRHSSNNLNEKDFKTKRTAYFQDDRNNEMNQKRFSLLSKSGIIRNQETNLIENTILLYHTLFLSLNLVSDETAKLTDLQIDNALLGIQLEKKVEFKNNFMNNLIFLFRDLSDEELNIYLKFYSSESGKKYSSLVYKCMREMFIKAEQSVLEKIKSKI